MARMPDHPALRSSKWTRAIRRAFGPRDSFGDWTEVIVEAERATDPASRVLALAHLVAWVRGSHFSASSSGARSPRVRFRFLVQALERQDEARAAVAKLISSTFREAEAPSLFAQTELNEQGGIFSEILRRLGDQLLPPPPRPHELVYAARVAFVGRGDDEWIESLDEGDWIRFCDLLASEPETALDHGALENDLRESAVGVALQAAALAMSDEVRARMAVTGPDGSTGGGGGGSSFGVLLRLAMRWRDTLAPADFALVREAISDGHADVARSYAAIEARGVSLSLVYRLETLSGLLRRLDLLLDVLQHGQDQRQRRLRARELFAAVARTRSTRRSVRALLDMNFDIFARRLVQHAGESGEHYIARDRLEYFRMLVSGAGGGAVTIATTFVKFMIYALKASLFFEGAFVWINYSGSFILMQLLGFTLATKQPSMTSAALADKMSRRIDSREIDGFVEEVACIARSQFAAAVGNVGFVFPGALLATWVFEKIAGHAPLSPEAAQHALDALHPFKSLTLWYAMLTGVVLWLSSFGAGFLQNWAIYRGLPEAIAQHPRARALFGARGAAAAGKWIARNASGLGGNLAIGFLLAFVPVLGKFLGMPIDIRHVTLSSGTVAVAVRSLGFAQVGWPTFGLYALSIALIGALNFGVSTACALAVAARARRVRRAWFRVVLGRSVRAFFRRPWRFFWPPAEPTPAAGGAGVD